VQDQLEHLDYQVYQEIQEIQELQEIQVHKGLLDHKGLPVMPLQVDLQVCCML
jgi:hypothetical protein